MTFPTKEWTKNKLWKHNRTVHEALCNITPSAEIIYQILLHPIIHPSAEIILSWRYIVTGQLWFKNFFWAFFLQRYKFAISQSNMAFFCLRIFFVIFMSTMNESFKAIRSGRNFSLQNSVNFSNSYFITSGMMLPHWKRLAEQLDVNGNPGHMILEFQKDQMRIFFADGLPQDGWNEYSEIYKLIGLF